MGGHYSKAHPEQSLVYKEMMDKRKRRKPERDLLDLAKEKYASLHPDADLKKDRSKIAYLKSKMKK